MLEFLNYLISSLKFGDVKLSLEGHSGKAGNIFVKLNYQFVPWFELNFKLVHLVQSNLLKLSLSLQAITIQNLCHVFDLHGNEFVFSIWLTLSRFRVEQNIRLYWVFWVGENGLGKVYEINHTTVAKLKLLKLIIIEVKLKLSPNLGPN